MLIQEGQVCINREAEDSKIGTTGDLFPRWRLLTKSLAPMAAGRQPVLYFLQPSTGALSARYDPGANGTLDAGFCASPYNLDGGSSRGWWFKTKLWIYKY